MSRALRRRRGQAVSPTVVATFVGHAYVPTQTEPEATNWHDEYVEWAIELGRWDREEGWDALSDWWNGTDEDDTEKAEEEGTDTDKDEDKDDTVGGGDGGGHEEGGDPEGV